MKSKINQGSVLRKVLSVGTKLVVAIALTLNLASCGEKATSTESIYNPRTNPQLTKQISEVSPPSVIQELRRSLEAYQPQVKIIAPKADEVLSEDNITVSLQVKDLPIYKDSKLELGSHLDLILDNQLYKEVYDLNQPLKITNLSAGTHTIRAYASRPWHESFKNADAYAQTTFHVFTKTDENNPSSQKPLITYTPSSHTYGAEPILLDFYLTNAPLQITAKNSSNDSAINEIGDWRIRCTINGESFILDRWESIYLKGWKVGKNWVKLDFLDGQGKPVKNVFNNTAKTIVYQPNGKDTLSKITRGDVSIAQVRSIVDPNYIAKEPIPESTPTPEVILEPVPELVPIPEPTTKVEKPLPEIEQPILPQTNPQPVVTPTPEVKKQSEIPKSRFGKFLQPKTTPEPVITPTPEVTSEIKQQIPEVDQLVSPQTTAKPVVTPTPEVKKQSETPKSRFGKYLQPKTTPEPTTKVEKLLPEIDQNIQPQTNPQPVITPTPEVKKQSETPMSRFGKYLQPKITPQPVINPTPEIMPTPTPD